MHRSSLAADVLAYRQAVQALPINATRPPPAGYLAWMRPAEVPGGLELSAWRFRLRHRAATAGRSLATFKDPFEAPLPKRRSKHLAQALRRTQPAAQSREA